MNAFAELKNASLGWLDLIAGRPGVEEKFNFSRAGLINAIGFFLVMAMANVAIAGAVVGYNGALINLVFNILPLGPLVAAVLVFGRLFGFAPIGPMVAGTYALAFVLLITLVLSLVAGDTFSNAMLGVFGFMLYRLGRGIAGLGIGIALAFAVLTLLLVVMVPLGMYLLLFGGPGAA